MTDQNKIELFEGEVKRLQAENKHLQKEVDRYKTRDEILQKKMELVEDTQKKYKELIAELSHDKEYYNQLMNDLKKAISDVAQA